MTIKGPNQLYADWDLDNVDFDRRNKKSQSSWKYLSSVTKKLSKNPDSIDILRYLPADPFIPMTAELVNDNTGKNLKWSDYSKARLYLINARVVNYVKMGFKKHNGILYKTSPHFLNALGKYYYTNKFGLSPDSVAMDFCQQDSVENRLFSVKHIEYLKEFYEKNGHHVKVGSYPFDLIIDNKHVFILTEAHENSIGIEMRLSEAIERCIQDNLTLYCPAVSVRMQKRVCAIVAGILFNSDIKRFSYVSYHEAEICKNIDIFDWSFYYTRPDEHGDAEPPKTLPFPKVDVNSRELVKSQMLTPKKLQNEQDSSDYKKIRDWATHMIKPTYINNICDYEIAHKIYVTVGLDQMGLVWRKYARNSSVILTGKCRETMVDLIKDFPELLIADDSNDKMHLDTVDIFRRNGSRIILANRQHAKAVLTYEHLLIHSMPTTNYMGNKTESYCLINFGEHSSRDTIYKSLYNMLHSLGIDDKNKFLDEWNKVKHLFDNKIALFAHFHGKKTIRWPYYNVIKSASRRQPVSIYTSHIDFKKIVQFAREIHIQGVSREANHKSLKLARCPVIKQRLWHPRVIFNDDFVAMGSWDMAQIYEQKELQVIIYLNDQVNPKRRVD